MRGESTPREGLTESESCSPLSRSSLCGSRVASTEIRARSVGISSTTDVDVGVWRGGGSGVWSGSRTVNRDPKPTWLTSVTSPPSSRASLRAIDRPRPVPRCIESPRPLGRTCSNSSKMRAKSDSLIPIPVSSTAISIASPASARRATTVTAPRSVNLMAFATRLRMTWRRCRGSV